MTKLKFKRYFMKKYYLSLFFFCFLFVPGLVLAQENDSSSGSQPKEILKLIDEVNRRSNLTDKIIESGTISIKTPQIDNSADLIVNLQRDDKIWFNIEATLGKDVAEAFYGRKNYLFYNALEDVVFSGPTKVTSIWATIRIKCTFDDLMNILSGTTVINIQDTDTLQMTEEGGYFVLTNNSKDPIVSGKRIIKYWILKSNYYVQKYSVFEDKMTRETRVEFSNVTSNQEGNHAKRIDIRRLKNNKVNEYFSFEFLNKKINQSGLYFNVSFPSDVRRVYTK